MSEITQHAKGQSCVRCGINDGTTCSRHYNGMRQQAFGKGRGIKCSDIAAAELCSKCDAIFTEGSEVSGVVSGLEAWIKLRLPKIEVDNVSSIIKEAKKVARSEQFMYYCLMTNIRRHEQSKKPKKYKKPSKVVARNDSGFAQ